MAGEHPTWSPNGRRLAFDDSGAIDVSSAGSPAERRVTGPATGDQQDIEPSWEPLCTKRGTNGRDVLRGSSRSDVICGFRGNDVIVGGPGKDRIFGEEGNDTIFARDGTFDVVGCGSGRDTVYADRVDLVGNDCERVVRDSPGGNRVR